MKTVLITGANKGLGLGFATVNLLNGNVVFATCRTPSTAEALLELQKTYNDSLHIVGMDVTIDASIQAAVEKIESITDHIDVLINNVGVSSKTVSDTPNKTKVLNELDRALLLKMFDINAISPTIVVQKFLDLLKKGTYPIVVNVTTQRASFSDPNDSSNYGYSASKVALNMMTKELTYELGPLGIKTFCVHPGSVKTDMNSIHGELEPVQAATNIMKIIETFDESNNGKFLNHDGSLFPL